MEKGVNCHVSVTTGIVKIVVAPVTAAVVAVGISYLYITQLITVIEHLPFLPLGHCKTCGVANPYLASICDFRPTNATRLGKARSVVGG